MTMINKIIDLCKKFTVFFIYGLIFLIIILLLKVLYLNVLQEPLYRFINYFGWQEVSLQHNAGIMSYPADWEYCIDEKSGGQYFISGQEIVMVEMNKELLSNLGIQYEFISEVDGDYIENCIHFDPTYYAKVVFKWNNEERISFCFNTCAGGSFSKFLFPDVSTAEKFGEKIAYSIYIPNGT